MKLQINITKEVLEATKMCGIGDFKLEDSINRMSASNCAITYACRKLFPDCITGTVRISVFDDSNREIIIAKLPIEAKEFIQYFDACKKYPENRVKIKPFSFEIELTKEALDLITIDEITEVLKTSTTLEVV